MARPSRRSHRGLVRRPLPDRQPDRRRCRAVPCRAAPHYIKQGVELDVAYLYERDNVWIPALEAAGAGVFSLAGAGGMPGAVRRAED